MERYYVENNFYPLDNPFNYVSDNKVFLMTSRIVNTAVMYKTWRVCANTLLLILSYSAHYSHLNLPVKESPLPDSPHVCLTKPNIYLPYNPWPSAGFYQLLVLHVNSQWDNSFIQVAQVVARSHLGCCLLIKVSTKRNISKSESFHNVISNNNN